MSSVGRTVDEQEIVAMGFTPDQARAALASSGGDLARAINTLLEQVQLGEFDAQNAPSRSAPSPAAPSASPEQQLPAATTPANIVAKFPPGVNMGFALREDFHVIDVVAGSRAAEQRVQLNARLVEVNGLSLIHI